LTVAARRAAFGAVGYIGDVEIEAWFSDGCLVRELRFSCVFERRV
jgi:hypothetical protein